MDRYRLLGMEYRFHEDAERTPPPKGSQPVADQAPTAGTGLDSAAPADAAAPSNAGLRQET